MAKSCLFYLLRKMKHELRTEQRIAKGYVDIVDQTTMTFYEIEFSHSKKFQARKYDRYRTAGYEIIIVDCSKMPLDLNNMKTYLEEFIVPD